MQSPRSCQCSTNTSIRADIIYSIDLIENLILDFITRQRRFVVIAGLPPASQCSVPGASAVEICLRRRRGAEAGRRECRPTSGPAFGVAEGEAETGQPAGRGRRA